MLDRMFAPAVARFCDGSAPRESKLTEASSNEREVMKSNNSLETIVSISHSGCNCEHSAKGGPSICKRKNAISKSV
jgi:hypothetical protein